MRIKLYNIKVKNVSFLKITYAVVTQVYVIFVFRLVIFMCSYKIVAKLLLLIFGHLYVISGKRPAELHLVSSHASDFYLLAVECSNDYFTIEVILVKFINNFQNIRLEMAR
jgi:hypothetical protein